MPVTNPDPDPDEVVAAPGGATPALQVIEPRDVPLGGPRAMTVRRTLPQRRRSLIGAWCFADHYGPDDVAETGGMQVPPHPHTGLATVSWLFTGLVEHRDSAGHHATVRPGELNLMTAGSGISHSERSTPDTTTLHGVQLWFALPERARFVERHFEHYVPAPVDGPGWSARVFVGDLLGSTSPVRTPTAMVGAELLLEPGAHLGLDVDPAFEHGLLVDTGEVHVDGEPLASHQLGYRAPGPSRVTLRAGDAPVRLVLIGGPPFGEQIVMWWNFVARSHDEIVTYRRRWQAEIEGAAGDGEQWYGLPDGDPDDPLPAPALPNAALRPRG